jgi:hypothetical protein
MSILANTITADIGLIPGFGIIGPLFGLPLSIMAAIIERPFLTAAGMVRYTVWYSIRANVLSLLIGYPLVLVAAALANASEGLLVLWPFIAVAISTNIERAYLSTKIERGNAKLPWGSVLAANAVSALVCLLLLVPVYLLDTYEVKQALRPYQTMLSIVLGMICVAAVIGSIAVPAVGVRSRESASSTSFPPAAAQVRVSS